MVTRTNKLGFDIMLNDYLAQKTKQIRHNEFDYLEYIFTEKSFLILFYCFLGVCIESSYNSGDISTNGGEKEVL